MGAPLSKLTNMFETLDKVSRATVSIKIPDMSFIDKITNVQSYECISRSNSVIDKISSMSMLNELNFKHAFYKEPFNWTKYIYDNSHIEELRNTYKVTSYINTFETVKSCSPTFDFTTKDSNIIEHLIPIEYATSKYSAIDILDTNISKIRAEIKSFKRSENSYTETFVTSDYLKKQMLTLAEIISSNKDYFRNSSEKIFDWDENSDDWKEKKKQYKKYLRQLLKKFNRVKILLVKKANKFTVNRRECFRKIYCFYFKNTDDTDSVALISIAY